MGFQVLDTVVLTVDLPDQGLKRGDLGAIVEIYDDERFDIEFVAATGRTTALVTLGPGTFRAIGPGDMPSVRSLGEQSTG